MDSKHFYKRQISLSEWFEDFNHKDKDAFRLEDNEKRERLRVLNKTSGVPFDKPTQFKATNLSKQTKDFKKYFKKSNKEYCALRLIPTMKGLPKLRMRGLTVEEAMDWFFEQEIDPINYRADFIPHSNNPLWSTIFVVNDKGIFGEIIYGMHNKLTQGFYKEHKPIQFDFDFKKLQVSNNNASAKKHILKVINKVRMRNASQRNKLEKSLEAQFTDKGYLKGYFETIETKEYGLWFIDYNRILGNLYKDFTIDLKSDTKGGAILKGKPASNGKVKGIVKKVNDKNINKVKFTGKEILVCEMTTPDHVLIMKKSAAVVTDLGGILCHAAIIAREFDIPCIVGTLNATKYLKSGDVVEVDAIKGVVKKLN